MNTGNFATFSAVGLAAALTLTACGGGSEEAATQGNLSADNDGLGGISGPGTLNPSCGTAGVLPVAIGNASGQDQEAVISFSENAALSASFSETWLSGDALVCPTVALSGDGLETETSPQTHTVSVPNGSTEIVYLNLGGTDYSNDTTQSSITISGASGQEGYSFTLRTGLADNNWIYLEGVYEDTGGTNWQQNPGGFNVVTCTPSTTSGLDQSDPQITTIDGSIMTPYSTEPNAFYSYTPGEILCLSYYQNTYVTAPPAAPTQGATQQQIDEAENEEQEFLVDSGLDGLQKR